MIAVAFESVLKGPPTITGTIAAQGTLASYKAAPHPGA